jgi:nitrite reductase/ring-hydroxylating ferredoxin subunit
VSSARFLCRLEQLGDPGSRGFEAHELGTPWDFFVARRGGRVFGYRNSCPHTGAPLDWQPHSFLDLERTFIQCAIHGALFHMESGECLRGPCLGRRLERVPVRVAGDELVLESAAV